MNKNRKTNICFARLTGLLLIGILCLFLFLQLPHDNKKEDVYEKDNMLLSESYQEQREESLAEYLQRGLVTVNYETHFGSGVIYDITDDSIIIMTAAHVVDLTAECTLSFYHNLQGKAEKVWKSETADLAWIQIQIEDIQNMDNESFRGLRKVREENSLEDTNQKLTLETGIDLIQGGAVSLTQLDFSEGMLINPKVYETGFQTELIQNNCVSKPGMSGGGLFNTEGRFLGMIVAGAENSTLCLSSFIIEEDYQTWVDSKEIK